MGWDATALFQQRQDLIETIFRKPSIRDGRAVRGGPARRAGGYGPVSEAASGRPAGGESIQRRAQHGDSGAGDLNRYTMCCREAAMHEPVRLRCPAPVAPAYPFRPSDLGLRRPRRPAASRPPGRGRCRRRRGPATCCPANRFRAAPSQVGFGSLASSPGERLLRFNPRFRSDVARRRPAFRPARTRAGPRPRGRASAVPRPPAPPVTTGPAGPCGPVLFRAVIQHEES